MDRNTAWRGVYSSTTRAFRAIPRHLIERRTRPPFGRWRARHGMGSGSGERTGQPRRGAVDFDEESGQTLKQHPAEYRRAAARARRLEAEATTSRVKQYLRAMIDQCERSAGEAEEVS